MAHSLSELIALSHLLLQELCERHPMGYVPRLVWKKLRVSAGIAKYGADPTILLSSAILVDAEKMESTLRHEYAHLLAVHRHGRRAAGHGRWWRDAMRELGCDPVVRHQYPVERNERRQEVGYRCKRCGALITRGRRLARGRKYFHVPCGGPLKLEFVRTSQAVSIEKAA